MAWTREHFGDCEVAIVYHDGNVHGIPPVHVVVDNTNLETGRHLQDVDPKELAALLQKMVAERGFSSLFRTRLRAWPCVERRNPCVKPATCRNEYVQHTEKELQERGEYSWTATSDHGSAWPVWLAEAKAGSESCSSP